MSESAAERPLQPGDRAPDIVLDAITREGKVALADYRGQNPVLVGLFRGLHCPFCRRHIAALAELEPELRRKGVQSLAVINTPIERARLYYRYHPLPNLLAAADPERRSHRAFGLPNLQITENETEWPYKISMGAAMSLRLEMPGELPEPMDPFAASELLDRKDGFVVTEADQEMMASGRSQLVGQFLLDRDGVVRWCFTEEADGGRKMFQAPGPQELMTAAALV
ncbi:peroxiredoxin-like family protein [Mesorhizobium sp. 1B3]|uniref:peroxiredoxin-like family protein n=1 Tax=Mesorhizobium sp. 1B3 TaxID=3243599 RepID=UPI003D9660D7